MKIKILTLPFSWSRPSSSWACGSTTATDEWFVLSEQTINSADPSVNIRSEGGRWEKGRQGG